MAGAMGKCAYCQRQILSELGEYCPDCDEVYTGEIEARKASASIYRRRSSGIGTDASRQTCLSKAIHI